MNVLIKIFLIVIITFPTYGRALSELTANEAYQIGKDLALHLKTEEAKPYLKYAADHGNTNAMVRYAYLSSSSSLFLSPDAYDYMLKAAKNGHEWAMFSVSDEMLTIEKDKKYWRKKFLDKMQPYIDKNNPDALYLMSKFKQGDEGEQEDWLIKAVNAGSCKAAAKLYRFYNNGNGWFFTSSRRKDKIKKLAIIANELSCNEGENIYISWLYKIGEYNKAWSVAQGLIDSGDAHTILSLGDYLKSSHNNFISKIPADYEKSAMLLMIYSKGFGKASGLKDEFDGFINEIDFLYKKLSEKQKQEVDSYVKEYLATHDIKVRDTIWETKFN